MQLAQLQNPFSSLSLIETLKKNKKLLELFQHAMLDGYKTRDTLQRLVIVKFVSCCVHYGAAQDVSYNVYAACQRSCSISECNALSATLCLLYGNTYSSARLLPDLLPLVGGIESLLHILSAHWLYDGLHQSFLGVLTRGVPNLITGGLQCMVVLHQGDHCLDTP